LYLRSNLGVNGQPPLHEGYTSNALNQYTMITNPRAVLISGEADPAQSVFAGLDTLDPQNLTAADRGPAPNNQHRYFARLSAPTPATTNQATVHDVNILALPGWISTYRTLVLASEQTLTYDADGNLASDGLWTYRYDAENRLTRMRMHPHVADWLLNKSGQTAPAWLEVRFMYDYQHRRVGKMVLTSQQTPGKVSLAPCPSGFWSLCRIRCPQAASPLGSPPTLPIISVGRPQPPGGHPGSGKPVNQRTPPKPAALTPQRIGSRRLRIGRQVALKSSQVVPPL
jgi:hypothetical protein